jgi:arylsulfatase A-like enzyme
VIDLAPTILHLAGGSWPTAFDGTPILLPPGKELSPSFAKDVPIERDYLWWLHNGNRAIRKGDWKLVAARNEDWELYDLAHDRAENRNLATQEPAKVRELSQLWDSELHEFQELSRLDSQHE